MLPEKIVGAWKVPEAEELEALVQFLFQVWVHWASQQYPDAFHGFALWKTHYTLGGARRWECSGGDGGADEPSDIFGDFAGFR